MAKADKKPKGKKESSVPAAEVALSKKLEALRAVKEPSKEQKAEKSTVAASLGALRFSRIANKRVPKVLKAIRSVAALAGAGYTRTPEQTEKVLAALAGAVSEVKAKFAGEVAAQEKFEV